MQKVKEDVMERFNSIYPFTSENIAGYMKGLDLTDKKVITHAVLGLTGIFRIWSCYDGVIDRNGGVWEHRI